MGHLRHARPAGDGSLLLRSGLVNFRVGPISREIILKCNGGPPPAHQRVELVNEGLAM